MYCGEWGHHG
ncbi:protein RPL31A [Kluyveromyces marxianus]|uniref:Protein RPL31A n=1 Tax=Kluyveromyces marxianus TaxID=4911 RepID=A0ABX6EV77_KLUMA|nr:protein RPL31A [Kluyveromyces marxianus]